jgi:SAM-dependent MidA family methyltransferase
VIERSPALVGRQRAKLGALAAHVTWTRADLSRRAPRPLGRVGFVVANEVLDCLAHEKVVWRRDGGARAVFVEPRRQGRALTRAQLAALLARRTPPRIRYREHPRPLEDVAGLRAFLERYCPERLGGAQQFPPYFACPAMPPLVQNVARLYETSEMLWIDYGDLRPFHLRAPERRRLFAGPPRSARSVYDAPGRDDVTFMVDFSVVEAAAREAGLALTHYGGQGALAAAGGVRLDGDAVALVERTRALGWMLDVMGLGPERAWRQGGLTFTRQVARGGALRAGIRRDVEEFLGRRPTRFRMMVLSTGPSAFRGSGTPATRTGC